MTTYAVNIGDATQDKLLAMLLIAPNIQSRIGCDAEPGKVDGRAVVMECDDETTENIIATIRLRYSRNLYRFYRATNAARTRWERI